MHIMIVTLASYNQFTYTYQSTQVHDIQLKIIFYVQASQLCIIHIIIILHFELHTYTVEISLIRTSLGQVKVS